MLPHPFILIDIIFHLCPVHHEVVVAFLNIDFILLTYSLITKDVLKYLLMYLSCKMLVPASPAHSGQPWSVAQNFYLLL